MAIPFLEVFQANLGQGGFGAIWSSGKVHLLVVLMTGEEGDGMEKQSWKEHTRIQRQAHKEV